MQAVPAENDLYISKQACRFRGKFKASLGYTEPRLPAPPHGLSPEPPPPRSLQNRGAGLHAAAAMGGPASLYNIRHTQDQHSSRGVACGSAGKL